MQAPDFWRTDNALARLLEPLGAVVGSITTRRAVHGAKARVGVPVICVGNLSTGGTGKTPVAHAIATYLADQGRTPAILLRGYGGRLAGPVKVDKHTHSSLDVGDEALLHARTLPTWVSRQRVPGARDAIQAGADVIVMDDGHQNGSIAKDLSLIVVDGHAGFGNGRVMPAGPLREPVEAGLARADAVILMGEDRRGLADTLSNYTKVLRARMIPGPERARLRGERVVAFAGIGDPEKFLRAVQEAGAQIVSFHPFDDHYAFDATDIQPILDEAFSVGAIPVTTEKDAVRLMPDQRQQVNVLSVGVGWEDPAALDALLQEALGKHR